MNIPNGFKLVPVEPTDDMVIAFAETWYSKRQAYDDPDMDDAYRDMLAAAPNPPQPIYDEAKERVLFSKWAFRVVGHGPYGDVHEMDSFDADYSEMEKVWLARAKAGEVGHE